MRFLFVILPVLLFGALGMLVDSMLNAGNPIIAVMSFVTMVAFGWSITAPRVERGES